MFVTIDDFKNFRYIPNLNQEVTRDILTGYIDEFEPKFMRKVFGYTNAMEIINNPTVSKYQLIINGGEYTDTNGELQYWIGLPTVISDYVYYYYIRGTVISLTSVGYNLGESENSSVVQPVTKPNIVWNHMVDYMVDLTELIEANPTDYPEWTVHQFERLNDFNL